MTAARHDRQSFLGPRLEATLAQTRIAVIGLCGGGSHVVQQLAHIGFSQVVLVDHDTADITNLNRMVGLSHRDALIERSKVDVLAERYRQVVPDAHLTCVNDRWESAQDLLKQSHIIIGCVDSYTARESLERFARRYLIAYIDVGMDVHEAEGGAMVSGQVITSLCDAPCMRCLGFLTPERLAREAEGYGAAGGRPQVVWPNGVLASTVVSQVMQILLPWGPGVEPCPYLVYDANRNLLHPSSRLRVMSGPCVHFDTSTGLGDVP